MLENIIGLGIAGNFAHHLEQAKEMADFVDVKTDEKNAPKGIFPFYVPYYDSFLGVNPFSSDTIIKPHNENIQLEPEIAILCDIVYDGSSVKALKPIKFTAYNDCSIRKDGAKKISHKKNWGKHSKGISEKWIDIDNFSENGILQDYSIVSYIKRDGKVIQYGDNCQAISYSYFGDKLINWLLDKINNQQDFGPLENILQILHQAPQQHQVIISIGATSYTDFGEHNYLDSNDEIYVIVYNHQKYKYKELSDYIEANRLPKDYISILKQYVV